MADMTDIREWLRARGEDVGDRGRIPKPLIDKYEAAHNGSDEPLIAVPDPEPEEETRPFMADPARASTASSASTSAGSGSGSVTGESAPVAGRRRGWRQRAPRLPQPDKTAKTHKRIPLETWAQRALKAVAYITGAGNTPTSRCINMMTVPGGVIIDEAVKGTVVDKFAQPIARWGEGGKNLGTLVGLPLMVAATERQPQLYPYTRPLMAELMTEWVLIAGPAMRKVKARAAEVARELAEFELDEDAVEGMFQHAAENPVIVKMLDAIFAPMMQPAPEPSEPVAA